MNRLRPAAAALALGVILFLTLWPTGQELPAGGWECALCDPRVTADFIANVLLFVPLGAALALLGWRTARVVGACVLLTGFIEVSQLLFLPGRDASLVDLVANSAGGLAGAVLVGWMRGRGRGRPLLPDGVLVLPLLGLLLPAVLLRPAPTGLPYQVRWEESPGGLEPYGGRVEGARVGDVELPRQRTVDSAPIREALGPGRRVTLRLVAGAPPVRLSHVFSLHDVRNREILLVAADGADLVVRYRTRAAAMRLDQPSHRWAGALRGVEAGEALHLDVRHRGARVCAAVEGRERCDFGAGVGRGWSLLLFAERFPQWLVQVLDLAWLALVLAPVGYVLRSGWMAVLPLAVPVLYMAAPLWGLPPLRPVEWIGMAVGVFAGALVGRVLRRRRVGSGGEGEGARGWRGTDQGERQPASSRDPSLRSG